MQPIRILHVIGSLNSGGSQAFVMNIYRKIDRTQIQFDFIIDKSNENFYEKEVQSLGGRVFILKNIKECNFIVFKKQWDTFFENHKEFKIIHGHVRSVAAIYLLSAKKHGLITIAHSHSTASRGNKFEQLIKNIMQIPIRYIADYLFACSDEAGKWLFGKKAIHQKNYKVIKNAINVNQYKFNETKRNEMRKFLGMEDNFVIGHVGSFTYPKNHKFLIDIFYEVQKKNKTAVLLLIGDGKLRSSIEKQIDNLEINEKVILTGVVPNVNDYLQAMDVFVFPSVFEGLGMAVIEAQISGLSCIISDVIPNETDIVADLIERIPLGTIDEWITSILRYKEYTRNKNVMEIAKSHGYSIIQTTEWITKFYLKIINKLI